VLRRRIQPAHRIEPAAKIARMSVDNGNAWDQGTLPLSVKTPRIVSEYCGSHVRRDVPAPASTVSAFIQPATLRVRGRMEEYMEELARHCQNRPRPPLVTKTAGVKAASRGGERPAGVSFRPCIIKQSSITSNAGAHSVHASPHGRIVTTGLAEWQELLLRCNNQHISTFNLYPADCRQALAQDLAQRCFHLLYQVAGISRREARKSRSLLCRHACAAIYLADQVP
jgi:hypothetical protein